ncbi:MAG TPA: hypothetical protein VGI43_20075 [Mucilaginibacter sp.]|jgi:hypothetical protein
MKRAIILLYLTLLFTLCDWKSSVAVIKNNTKDTIDVVPWDDRELGLISDSRIYNNRIYMPDVIKPNDYGTITLQSRNFSKAPDSAKIDLYVFSLDSLSRYQKRKLSSNILNHCLLRKVTMQANKITKDLDTIYIK